MCGITGIVAPPGARVPGDTLQRMTDLIAHRGPDGEGFVLGSRFVRKAMDAEPAQVGLGHRRLAILDLSDRGIQPISVNGGRTWIVFNGEIYNFRELKAELAARGCRFKTRTDTEVLLHCYLTWGEACLERLQGMFAFAIWDEPRGVLFCARDRLGIKPFYYTFINGWLSFASEIKALVSLPGQPRELDDDAALAFLIHSNCDYGERTLFRDVKALPGGHALRLEVGSGRLEVRRYWELVPQSTNGTADSSKIADLRELLMDSMQRHLISDVRAGSCLSGGIDSSVVVGLVGKLWREQPEAATALGDRFFTFTSCWDNPECDEREFALAAANAAGATPHLVFPTAQDFWDSFPRMAWHQDMPFGSFSYYAQWSVMRAARDAGVKVLLDGQGGDEVFGGYAKFRYAYFASLFRSGRWPSLARELTAAVLQNDNYVLDVRKGFRYLPAPLRRLLGVDTMLKQVLRADWNRTVAAESTPATRWWRYATNSGSKNGGNGDRNGHGPTLMQRVQVDDIVVDTLPMLLRMEDRSSMAFSLEARVPLLDHRVVELGVSLPDHLKVQRGWSKYAMREAARSELPDLIRRRTTKLGFAAPDRAWLGTELRPQITALIEEHLQVERFVDVPALRRWYGSAASRVANTETYLGLFRVVALEMWMRAFAVT
jgi:asparagine synthase (glutamine-hydrolysing)